ncbi:type II secretion system protein [Paenibacillus sp. BSR1-1]|uniref:prepilin-type N-terminal cleavage/methylation domain-containing protein n=1 Tax=Paenibacillus sp. BSR1-1 TaxID=3020845 RepID=UPI0025B11F26|nr:type II secretion system protein [Paenibacillus sp. BSR1-1]MDN3018509.1 type II secretion system protein [Paenibacillus sp. BSR1-1]
MVQALKLKMKEQKGFTLIELLAVIVILGIIAAIAIPAISNVISKSDAKAKAQEGVQIINAARMYVANEPKDADSNLTRTQLMDYLDRVDRTGQFYVTYGNDASGVLTYVLHEDSNDSTGKTEQALINAAK